MIKVVISLFCNDAQKLILIIMNTFNNQKIENLSCRAYNVAKMYGCDTIALSNNIKEITVQKYGKKAVKEIYEFCNITLN